MSDLQRQITLIHGATERGWEVTTSVPTDEDQGIILIQFHEGTDPETVEQLHKIIETAVEGVLGE